MRWSLVLGIVGALLMVVSFLPWFELAATPTGSRPSASSIQAEGTTAKTVDYGRALFQVKGCQQCHHHRDIPESVAFSPSNQPVLSEYAVIPEYVRRWLSDPQSVKSTTLMPNLNLAPDEIESLIVFLAATTTKK